MYCIKLFEKYNYHRFPKTVNETLGIIAYFPFGIVLAVLRFFIAINAIFLTFILNGYPTICR